MSQMLLFLGRFHVVVLHLPIGILLLAAIAELLSRRPRFAALQPAVGFLWFSGALAAVGTVVLGLLHAREGGFDAAALRAHGLAGGAVAVLACAVWALRSWGAGLYQRVWPAAAAGMLALLTVTGHLGGNLTHGETYLVQYAPAPIQHLLGTVQRDRPATLEAADIYLDVVAPALEQRCVGCHNPGKRKGQLDLSTHAALMKGGEKGAVVVAGKPVDSDLFRRISLAPDHSDYMPKEGKTPLTADQVAAIGWWISRGAPATGALLAVEPPKDMRTALARVLGFAGGAAAETASPVPAGEGQVAGGEAPVDVPAPSPEAVAALVGMGFEVRSIARDNPLVAIDYVGTTALGKAQLDGLAKLAPQVHSLNLRSAGVTDAHLATIGRFEHLVNLRLELNPVTDAGVASLSGLRSLQSLNLYGTRVTDRSVPALGQFKQLQRLYLWQTGVTQAGIATLQRNRPGLVADTGFDQRRFPPGPKVIPVVN